MCPAAMHKREQEKRRNELVLNHRGPRDQDDDAHEPDPDQESHRQPAQRPAPDVHTFGGNRRTSQAVNRAHAGNAGR